MDNQERLAEIDRNFDYFQRHVADLMPDHADEYALIHNRGIIGFFPTVAEADGETSQLEWADARASAATDAELRVGGSSDEHRAWSPRSFEAGPTISWIAWLG